MLCINVKRYQDGYCVISLTDTSGAHSSYCGWGNQPALRLFEDQGIDIR